MEDTNNRVFIMKIASGPLSGSELMLKTGAHRVIISPAETYRTESNDDGFITYFLPGEEHYYELSLIAGDHDDTSPQEAAHEDALYLVLSGDCPQIKQPVVFQEIMLAEYFPVLIKMLDSPRKSTEKNTLLPVPVQGESDARSGNSASRRVVKLNPAYPLAIVLLALIAFVGWQVVNYNSAAHKVKTLESMLQGSSSPLKVTTSDSGNNLVLVKTQRDLDWSTQRLLQERYQEPVKILKFSMLEQELEEQLSSSLPGLLKVDLSLPCKPIIRQLKGDYPRADNKLIEQVLSHMLACHQEKPQIEYYSSGELFKKAEQGLSGSNVPWRVVNKNSNPVFIINANLNDKQTLSAIDFSERFTKKYGTRYIKFSIVLATDHLAGKSFINNPNGYVFLDNNHWYFNSVSL